MSQAETTRKRPTGRRVGDSGTRDAILDAARDLFAERGYDGASIRAIATAAGVDPALIRHFFGDKDALFAAIVADRSSIPERIAMAMSGSEHSLGERIADTYLRMWEEPETRAILFSLVRSAVTSGRAAEMLMEIMGARLRNDPNVGPINDRRMRSVALAASHLFGVAVSRHILHVPPLVELSHEDLVAEVAPTVQRYISGQQ